MQSARRLIPLLAVPFLTGCGGSHHPSDSVLLENFMRNEEGFERLIAMLREDRELSRVANNWTCPTNPSTIGVTPERINTYRKLFGKLLIPEGCSYGRDPRDGSEGFEFISSTYGLMVGGSWKGYVHLQKPPGRSVMDLDAYQPPEVSFTAYRHIKGNWYLVLSH
jgi:hypothetical protein